MRSKTETSFQKSDHAILNSSEIFNTLWNFFLGLKKSYGEKQNGSDEETLTAMKVIGAGYCRTSTSSLMEALRRLHLKSYHMRYVILDHMSFWYDHARQCSKEGSDGKIQLKEKGCGNYFRIIRQMALEGYNATVDDPNSWHFQELMEAYPTAWVILSVRKEEKEAAKKSFAKSYRASIAQVSKILIRPPWKWLAFVHKFKYIREWGTQMRLNIAPPSMRDEETEENLAAAYDAWVKHVKSVVPLANY